MGSGAGDPFGPRCHRGDLMGCGIIFSRDYQEATSRRSKRRSMKPEAQEGAQVAAASSSEEPTQEDISETPSDMDDELMFDSDDSEGLYEDIDESNDGWVVRPDYRMVGAGRGYPPDFQRDIRRIKKGHKVKKEVDETGPKVEVFFTRNNAMIGKKEMIIPKGGFYPTVGMLSSGEKVRVDLQPFTG